MIEAFADNPGSGWRFFSDTVTGGKSAGQVQFEHDDDRHWARMTGTVSTANNGGFIQIQRRLEPPLTADLGGVRLVARGNEQRYFIHLRRTGESTPTAFYRAGFDVTSEWREIRLPFSLFTASKHGMQDVVAGTSFASMTVVGFGRYHHADICISEIGSYRFQSARGTRHQAPAAVGSDHANKDGQHFLGHSGVIAAGGDTK